MQKWNDTRTRKALVKRLFLTRTKDERLWATNSYWAFRVDDINGPLDVCLRKWNIKLEPGCYDVGQGLAVSNDYTKPPELDTILSESGVCHEIVRHRIAGKPALIRPDDQEALLRVYDRTVRGTVKPSCHAMLNDEFMLFLEAHLDEGNRLEQSETSEVKPVRMFRKDELVALIMTVRIS